ncbi:hypothetical protein BJ170DRAFT_69118 [Xylariales sp. AK1849]|nr:hypothetical protein BJ170DRAFT_69118 [Xylariales sp. AK1849]
MEVVDAVCCYKCSLNGILRPSISRTSYLTPHIFVPTQRFGNMTAHMMPLALRSLSGAHCSARLDQTGLSLDRKSQDIGSEQPRPGFPETKQVSMVGSEVDTHPIATYSTRRNHNLCLDNLHIIELDHNDIVEVETALQAFKDLEMDGDDVNRERFPLPNLESRLDRCALEIHYGTGLCVIRGLDPKKYSIEDNMMIFLGISSYIGNQRGLQSSKGAMISHVTESKLWSLPRGKRHGIHTNEHLPFHSDMGSDILAIHVRCQAEEGGRTCVASSAAIYNDLVESNPSAIHTLSKHNWPIQSFKRQPPYVLSPLLEIHHGNLIISMDPGRIGPHTSTPKGVVPDLTSNQQMALADMQKAAEKHQLKLNNRPGDLLYINNWSILHAREAYRDAETSSRHLVRLWLRNEALGWPVPDSMRDPWDSAFGDKARAVVNRRYALIPMPTYMESKYTNGTAAFVPDDDEPETGGP